MTSDLGLRHIVHTFNEDELFDPISVVAKTMMSFNVMEIVRA